ncbi:FAD-dependent oxidoreductase, partial [Escherichia coli]|nr:FAD-dependent oxidoreductase [Escherichia coli]
LEGLYRKGLENSDVEIFESRALLIDDHTIEILKTGKRVTADQILIAVGGHPSPHPSLPGNEFCISSNEAFHLDTLPKAIVIEGGGYI